MKLSSFAMHAFQQMNIICVISWNMETLQKLWHLLLIKLTKYLKKLKKSLKILQNQNFTKQSSVK